MACGLAKVKTIHNTSQAISNLALQMASGINLQNAINIVCKPQPVSKSIANKLNMESKG